MKLFIKIVLCCFLFCSYSALSSNAVTKPDSLSFKCVNYSVNGDSLYLDLELFNESIDSILFLTNWLQNLIIIDSIIYPKPILYSPTPEYYIENINSISMLFLVKRYLKQEPNLMILPKYKVIYRVKVIISGGYLSNLDVKDFKIIFNKYELFFDKYKKEWFGTIIVNINKGKIIN